MSELTPSRRDEREAKLALCNAALMKGDPAYAANLVPWLIAEVRSLSQQLDAAKGRLEKTGDTYHLPRPAAVAVPEPVFAGVFAPGSFDDSFGFSRGL